MPFQMKIQPIDYHIPEEGTRSEVVKPVVKSRLKWLFERQFSGVLKISAVAKKIADEELQFSKDDSNGSIDFEPSSVCLANMVQNFMEENPEKHSASVKCGRNRCNCFNRNSYDSSEDESDVFGDSNSYSSTGEAAEILKGLVACASICERNLLADTSKIVEKNKICKCKDDFSRKIVVEGLLALGYEASICKSRWEKCSSYPAGDYEYIDVIIGNERVLIDMDFRSEFEIARPTKTYKMILQTLPHIFVGKSERLQSIIAIVSDAAKQSLKKKGMHIPPWRKAEYVKAKWLSPHTRTTPKSLHSNESKAEVEKQRSLIGNDNFELIHGKENSNSANEGLDESVFAVSDNSVEEKIQVVTEWKPPELKPRSSYSGVKMVTGLAAVFDDNP